MNNFKKYLKNQLEQAKLNDWFDENGNSVTATSNRTLINEIKLDFENFNYDIKELVNFKELFFQLIGIIVLLSLPLTYFPILILRSFYSIRQAKKEMMTKYINDKIDILHK